MSVLAEAQGVVAQELETIFPGLVRTNKKGLKSVKYSVFTPIIIKAIQEQQEIIESQKAQIDSIMARLDALEKK